MSSIIKLTQQLKALTSELQDAQKQNNIEESERLEELIYDISSELDELNGFGAKPCLY